MASISNRSSVCTGIFYRKYHTRVATVQYYMERDQIECFFFPHSAALSVLHWPLATEVLRSGLRYVNYYTYMRRLSE
jgi:hypothetical protein